MNAADSGKWLEEVEVVHRSRTRQEIALARGHRVVGAKHRRNTNVAEEPETGIGTKLANANATATEPKPKITQPKRIFGSLIADLYSFCRCVERKRGLTATCWLQHT